MVVVEVRQGTLGVDGRGWGPAENTVDRGSQLSKDDEDDEEDEEEEERRTRQEEAEDEEEKEEEKEEEDEEATDIKSNNPHLAGGELFYCDIHWSPGHPIAKSSVSAPVHNGVDAYEFPAMVSLGVSKRKDHGRLEIPMDIYSATKNQSQSHNDHGHRRLQFPFTMLEIRDMSIIDLQ